MKNSFLYLLFQSKVHFIFLSFVYTSRLYHLGAFFSYVLIPKQDTSNHKPKETPPNPPRNKAEPFYGLGWFYSNSQ